MIRVEVPATRVVAVNQFEKGDVGSQIHSGAFEITNKSDVLVKVSVTSTATLDSTKPVTLVAIREAANSTAEDGETWHAFVALMSAGKYTEETGKGVTDLIESNENVTTFEQGSDNAKSTATVVQTFYLEAVHKQ